MTAPTDSSVTIKILSIDHTLLFFSSLFYFIVDNCKYGSLLRKVSKNEDFFTFHNNLFKN